MLQPAHPSCRPTTLLPMMRGQFHHWAKLAAESAAGGLSFSIDRNSVLYIRITTHDSAREICGFDHPVSRCHEDVDRRPSVLHGMSQSNAVHRSWHVDVCKDRPYRWSGLQDWDRFICVGCLENVKSGFFEHDGRIHANERFVLDNNDRQFRIRHVVPPIFRWRSAKTPRNRTQRVASQMTLKCLDPGMVPPCHEPPAHDSVNRFGNLLSHARLGTDASPSAFWRRASRRRLGRELGWRAVVLIA
jgi:hypothetical protein